MTKVPDEVIPATYTPKVAVDPVAAVKPAHFALQQANDDFERLAIRDQARAAQAAAKILGLRDIQVQASEIVARAERAIVIANPPMPVEESAAKAVAARNVMLTEHDVDSNSNESTEIPAVDDSAIRKMRQAHAMPDTKFEAVLRAAHDKQQPLTRRSLQREAAKDAPDRTVSAPTNGRTPPGPALPVDAVTAEAMRQRIASMLVEVSDRDDKIEDLEAKLEFYRQQQYPDAAARQQLLNNQRAQIKSLTSQVREWQTKFEDQRRETPALRRERKKAGLTR